MDVAGTCRRCHDPATKRALFRACTSSVDDAAPLCSVNSTVVESLMSHTTPPEGGQLPISDLGFRKPITFLSGRLMLRRIAHNFGTLADYLSHAFSDFLFYLLYELL
jgi:hypothetical protein